MAFIDSVVFEVLPVQKTNETCRKWNFYDLESPNVMKVVIVLEGEFENESVIGEVNMLFVGVQGKSIKSDSEDNSWNTC